jgi:pimeloyl-ACP methyl ester carboxylesterase
MVSAPPPPVRYTSGMGELSIESAGVTLSGEEAGEGTPVVLLHGLTATRRYVVMGSKALERDGHRVITYDARGHGASTPAPTSDAYGYDHLSRDLLAVLDACGIEQAVLAGSSMGGQTVARFAIDEPERVAAVVIITPAFEPGGFRDLPHWDRLSDGLRSGGVQGFIAAMGELKVPEQYQTTFRTVLEQRLSAHAHPEAVADALRVVPRAQAFTSWSELGDISAPTLVIGSRDEIDFEHPLEIAERYAISIPGARLIVEDAGKSPLAWQGGRVSAVIAEAAAMATA